MEIISGSIARFIPPLIPLALAVMVLSCDNVSTRIGTTNPSPEDSLKYVGRKTCKTCHLKQCELFDGSDHDRSMDMADSSTVLGDFSNATYSHLGIVSRFYRRDGRYYVYTEGADGEMREFRVDFVFGVRPLQQYLVAFPGGRYQCLPICWDTRPKEQGGQKWFHIYGDEKIMHTDFLYWTRVMQNWNYMCAECHSTNLKKSFDPETDTYHTTWSEIDVSCEACHGPCSAHIAWAEGATHNPAGKVKGSMGLVIRHTDSEEGTWVFRKGKKVAERTVRRDGRKTLETCARCHSRRMTLTEDYTFGHSLLDTHRPSLLEADLYFPDGQIRDEVYVYASFLQSKMYHKGVICSDCHEPHSLKVYVQGNALCYRCHLPDVYGGASHHFHKDNPSGALCMECHMPERTYMQVDPRRDHSMRIPRPDLSIRLGTPNACAACHEKLANRNDLPNLSDPQMMTDWFFKWYGRKDRGVHYGESFWEARRSYPEALRKLTGLAADTALPAMVRSTACYYLCNYDAPSILPAIRQGLRDPDPLIRFGALQGSTSLSDEERTGLYRPLLNDPVRLIRTQAARLLPPQDTGTLDRTDRQRYNRALSEYLEIEAINADHPFTWLNLGNFYIDGGRFPEAEQAYLRAISIEPALPQSYINLTDLYRRLGRDPEGEKVLTEALHHTPGSAPVHHALGLLFIRSGKRMEGLEQLKQAARLDPANARFSYVYGVGLYATGKCDDAIEFLEHARKTNPFDRDILFSLISYYRETGKLGKAIALAGELSGYYPEDPACREMVHQLNSIREGNR